MTVYLPRRGRTWYYDFWWRGRRYRNTTGQLTREDAQLAEAKLKIRLRQEAGGIGAFDPARTPRIQDWAEVYAEHALRKPINEERLNGLVRCVLRFWGARPSKPEDVDATAPYHDLRLGDPIADAAWLQRWEDWLGTRRVRVTGRPISGQTRNQYRSTMRQLYKVACSPRRRQQTGIETNPLDASDHDLVGRRIVALSVEEMRRWVSAASYHVRLAVAIAALAPKLRLGNILGLE